jgi:uncharacterized protein YecE (DUF72 family)
VEKLAEIRLGTSSFTAAGWEGSFYPKGMKSAERLSFYAEHFDTVEIDFVGGLLLLANRCI